MTIDHITEENLSHQAEAIIASVLHTAEMLVGYARLAEAYAIAIVANPDRIAVLEQLLDDKITFAEPRTLAGIRAVKAAELD